MNDDSLNDTNPVNCPHGVSMDIYCEKCSPKGHVTWKENIDGFPIPTFNCHVCKTSTKGFSLCLKCNPQTYRIVGIEKALADNTENEIKLLDDVTLGVWNAAIEEAAKIADKWNFYVAEEIRGLKK